jgi:hypothetical protein
VVLDEEKAMHVPPLTPAAPEEQRRHRADDLRREIRPAHPANDLAA